MRVLYDSQIFRIQKFGGVSRYCAELVNGLDKEKEFEVFPKKFYSYNSHLSLLGFSRYTTFKQRINVPGKFRIENYIRKLEDKKLLKTIKNREYDIFHPTYYYPAHLDLLDPHKPLIATIHDMTYELYYDKKFSKIHDESVSKKKLIKRANHIIAVSQRTKDDILALYPEIDEKNISVIYHGSSLPLDIAESKIDLPARYLLYVGKRGKYKNFAWLLDALAEYLVSEKIMLVCAGGRPFSEEEKKLMAEKKLADKVSYYNIDNDADLATIYRKAACFIYPSSHEGFGIPILEAYSSGCPVLLANSSCFPEIGSDGALYFDNENKEQLITQLSRILGDKNLSADLVKNGYRRLTDFSWEKTVLQHIDVYRKVMNSM